MNLTHRQKQVVSGIAASIPAKQIAGLMGISYKCVDYHKVEAKVKIIASRTLSGICGSETDALFTHYALKHKLITLKPPIEFLGRKLVTGEVDYCYLTDPCQSDQPVRRGSFRNKGNRLDMGQSRHKHRSLDVLRILHGKPNSAGNELAFAGSHHQSGPHQRRSATGVHKLPRSRRVLLHDERK